MICICLHSWMLWNAWLNHPWVIHLAVIHSFKSESSMSQRKNVIQILRTLRSIQLWNRKKTQVNTRKTFILTRIVVSQLTLHWALAFGRSWHFPLILEHLYSIWQKGRWFQEPSSSFSEHGESQNVASFWWWL